MSSVWLDRKYINLSATTLLRFKWVSKTVANFRCPFCGDSTSSKIKARGYLFPNKQTYLYKCHRCGISLPFGAFLKRLSRTLFDEYIMEKFDIRKTPTVANVDAQVRAFVRFEKHPHVHQLSEDTLPSELENVRVFVRNRQLPADAMKRLYATAHARTWLTEFVGPEKAQRIPDGVPCLVIPLCLPDKTWYGAQVRTLHRKEYYTFRWGHDTLRVFGLDTWDPYAQTLCVEGPLDALCVPNALAFCGPDFQNGLQSLANAGYPVRDRVLIWDNEPRNREITRRIQHAIRDHERVVIWRDHHPKDLNDMLKQGYDILTLIQTHTYKGLFAELEYQLWVKSS